MRPYIANETQARKELARLNSIALWLQGRIDEMQTIGNATWVSVYGDRLSNLRSDVKYITRYLATCPA